MARKKRKDTAKAGFASQKGRRRLTPMEVQEKEFRLSAPLLGRGYREADVDEFLDHITEELALLHEENKRLREKVDEGGGATPQAMRAAEHQAAEIIRQAREHAARLLEQAEAGTGAPAPAATFLVRERDFLQRMAALIQEHAEALKRDARRGKAAEAHASSPAQPAAPSPEPEPAAEPEIAPAPAEESSSGWADEPTQSHDPLLDEWDEGAVGGTPTDEPYESSDLFGEGSPKEPESNDLRELFWGEEG